MFVTFVSMVKIDNVDMMTPPQINTLICSGKAPTELCRMDGFSML
jgi:hypothetical protein